MPGRKSQRRNWSYREDAILRDKHDEMGGKWSEIDAFLPGRNVRAPRTRERPGDSAAVTALLSDIFLECDGMCDTGRAGALPLDAHAARARARSAAAGVA